MEYEETDLQTETEQHSEAQKLFKGEWEYKAIGDREQQTMTSIGVRLPQRIVSLGVWFSHCLMVTRLRTCTASFEQDCLEQLLRFGNNRNNLE
jgi:hypothetical protein